MDMGKDKLYRVGAPAGVRRSLLQPGGPVQYDGDGVRRRVTGLRVHQEALAVAGRDIRTAEDQNIFHICVDIHES